MTLTSNSLVKRRFVSTGPILLMAICLCFAVLSCSKQEADRSIPAGKSSVEQRQRLARERGKTSRLPGEPDIQFDSTSHDFGTIFQMRSYDCVFKLRNAGTAELLIDRVSASCGCTATLLSEKEIEPGGEADLKVTFESRMFERPIAKRITVRSNDPDEPVRRLQVKANVVPRLAVEPKSLYFKDVHKRKGAVGRLTVRPAGREKVKSLGVKSLSERFRAELEPTNGEKGEYLVKVSLAEDVPVGRAAGYIQFFINNEKDPCARIRATANLVGDIYASPRRLVLKTKRGTDTDPGTITVASNVSDPLQILGVDSDVAALKLQVSPVEEGKRYAVVARLAPDTPEGRTRGNITIRTNNMDQPTIRVPVYTIVE